MDKNLSATRGTRVQSLVQEDLTCYRATKPLCHRHGTYVLQLLEPMHPEPVSPDERSHCSEKSVPCNEEQPSLAATRESPCAAMKTQWNNNYNLKHKLAQKGHALPARHTHLPLWSRLIYLPSDAFSFWAIPNKVTGALSLLPAEMGERQNWAAST